MVAADYSPPPLMSAAEACKISPNCKKPIPDGFPPCDIANFKCMCDASPTIEGSKFFDPHCIFEECTDTEARKVFLRTFLESCTIQDNWQLVVPPEWAPYSPSSLPTATQAPSSTFDSNSPQSTPAQATTSTTVSIIASRGTPTTTTTPFTPMASNTAQAAPTDWAKVQKPICGITERCLINGTENDPCKLFNLQCVCTRSNSISSSTYFYQGGLFDECYGDQGRMEWMDAFAYACDTIGRPMIDVNDQWQRYVPQWYLDKNATVSTSSIPLSTATSTSSAAPAAPANKSPPLSEGAIGGIVVAGACLIAILLAGFFLLRRMRKKVDRKTKEAAELADTHHRDGFQARIDQLRYGHNSQESLGTTAVAASSRAAHHDPHDPYAHDPYGHYKPPVQGSKSPGTTYQAYKPGSQQGSFEPYRHGTPFRTSTGSPCGNRQEDIHPAHRSPVYEHYATKPRYSTDEILPVQRSPVYDEHGNKVGYQ
ncbi:hypothetical protein BKA63DRAFT_558364 [Paraphoma chrysanthemicola]|nr:hypothetical protein BKA63DRAFT_558364 [Paraphoma chrysanthemicola]